MAKETAFKDEKVEVRLTAEEKALFQLAAERLDMTVSEYVRMWCLPPARLVAASATAEQFHENAAGTADYMTLRYQTSSLSPSPSPEPQEDESEKKD